MVAVGVRSVAVEVVVVVAVGSGGVLCVVLAFFLSGVWSAGCDHGLFDFFFGFPPGLCR